MTRCRLLLPILLGLCAACPGPIEPPLPQCTEASACAAPASGAAAQLVGAWSGPLRLRQTLGDQTEEAARQATLEFDANTYPLRHLAALGFFGDWRAYASGSGGPLNLAPLFSGGGCGDVYAYYTREADGPANRIRLRTEALTSEPGRLSFTYAAAYRFADLLHYTLYAYTAASAPEVTLCAAERYERQGDTLKVDARATGADPTGRRITYEITGTLQRDP